MSIFDLEQDELKIAALNRGMNRMAYEQQAPTRDITNGAFGNGAINFRWECSGTKWWVPSRSYLRMRVELSKTGGPGVAFASLLQGDNVAPAMNLMSTLFQSMEFRINDKLISRVSELVPQVDTLEKRLSKSKSWLDGVGKSTNFWESDVKIRKLDSTSDGKSVSPALERTDVANLVGGDVTAVAATGVVTFANAQTNNPWLAGDEFEITVAGLVTRAPVLSVAANNLSLRIGALTLAADVAAQQAYSRYRNNYTNEARNLNTFEITWTPCLSVYKLNHALPTGRYELVLVPNPNYKTYAIESTGSATKANADYYFNIKDFYHYVNTVEGARFDNGTYYLDLQQTSCTTRQVGTSNSLKQEQFDVSPSTYALTVAFGDTRVGTDTRVSASKFRAYDDNLVSQEGKLTRFMLQYAGQSLPNPDADTDYRTGVDLFTQRYNDSILYSGGYFETGGAETIEEWRERGQYLYFAVPRDGTDRSTRVTVNFAMGNATTPATDLKNTNLLLFAHSKQVAMVKVQDGRVTDCQLEDA